MKLQGYPIYLAMQLSSVHNAFFFVSNANGHILISYTIGADNAMQESTTVSILGVGSVEMTVNLPFSVSFRLFVSTFFQYVRPTN